MIDKILKYFLYLSVLSFMVISVIILRRISREVESTAKQVEYIHNITNQNDFYRMMRNLSAKKRAVLYPAKSTFRPGIDTLEVFQQRIRADIKKWIGLDEELIARSIQIHSLGKDTTESGKLILEDVEFSFQGSDLWSLRGYFIYPVGTQDTRLPGILILNGHVGSARKAAGLDYDFHYDGYGLGLAEMGFKVLTFDWSFEYTSRLRNSQGKEYRGHDGLYDYMKDSGRTGLALYMENAYCAFQALLQDPGVDPSRIGVTGLSRGGELTSYFAALFAPQFSAYYASGAGFPFVYRRFGGGCDCTRVKKIFENYEFYDLLVAAAPLPGRLQLGVRDDILGYWDNIEDILGMLRPLYTKLGAPEAFDLDVHEKEHVYYISQAQAFFSKVLRNSAVQ